MATLEVTLSQPDPARCKLCGSIFPDHDCHAPDWMTRD